MRLQSHLLVLVSALTVLLQLAGPARAQQTILVPAAWIPGARGDWAEVTVNMGAGGPDRGLEGLKERVAQVSEDYVVEHDVRGGQIVVSRIWSPAHAVDMPPEGINRVFNPGMGGPPFILMQRDELELPPEDGEGDGTSGSSGISGATGASGAAGASGASGSDVVGTAGMPGTSGSSGAAGATGSADPEPPDGATGSDEDEGVLDITQAEACPCKGGHEGPSDPDNMGYCTRHASGCDFSEDPPKPEDDPFSTCPCPPPHTGPKSPEAGGACARHANGCEVHPGTCTCPPPHTFPYNPADEGLCAKHSNGCEPGAPNPGPSTPPSPPETATLSKNPDWNVTYIIERGDSLGDIAVALRKKLEELGVAPDALPDIWGDAGIVNRLSGHNLYDSPDRIFAGKSLTIPKCTELFEADQCPK